jgi:hypothetical protein
VGGGASLPHAASKIATAPKRYVDFMAILPGDPKTAAARKAAADARETSCNPVSCK